MRKLIIGGLSIVLMLSLMGCGGNNVNKVETIDIIGLQISDARLLVNGEYLLNQVSLPTSEFLPGVVISYGAGISVGDLVEEGAQIDVVVAGNPENSKSLSSMVEYTSEIGFITGPDSPNFDLLKDAGVGGCDLGIPVQVGDEMILLYGDTFSGVGSFSGLWFSNYMARSSDYTLSDGLTFSSVVTNQSGMALPFMQGQHNLNVSDEESSDMTREVTKIPTGGITIGDTVYIFYMSVRYWVGWLVSYNQVVKASVDDLTHFEEVSGLSWSESEAPNFGQIYPVKDPNSDYIYLFSIPGGRSGGTVLSRVHESNFENRDEYEYYTAKNTWVKGNPGLQSLKNDPYYIISPACSELSVMYNNYLDKWMVVYLKNSSIIFQTADTLTSSWSTPEILVSLSDYPGLYGGFVHQKYTEYDGKKFYMVISRWLPIYQTELIEVVLK
ncbi:MAG: DUF4185 domain-containing protein [Candidatus Izemoplasmatales bacterium]|nr:DUF4185 domain-containing protein [Candidatus Izemoplasmatales bacterium]